jgi:hypothetical protein
VQARTWKSFWALLLAGASVYGIAVGGGIPSKGAEQVTLNGVVFTLPQRYVKVTGEARENFVFLYDQQHKEGMVVTVPAAPFVEQDVLDILRKASLKILFPKETRAYTWKSAAQPQKVSKFEVGDFLAKGFNQSNLVVFECRHIIFDQKDVFVGMIFEARKGRPAAEMFNGEGTAMSMTACAASAEIIYSFTGEKIDPDKPPCELIANIP